MSFTHRARPRIAGGADPLSILITGALAFCAAPTATAAKEMPVVENPASPAEGIVRLGSTELWRVGGEDDEIFFGNVATVDSDANGNVYVLDSQLSEVQVYSPDGEHLRTISGEGDGPGEVRNPGDLFIAADGNVCIIQTFPGKIIELTPTGDPVGTFAYAQSGGSAGQFDVLIRGRSDGDGMLLGGIRQSFGADGMNNQVYFLDRCDRRGVSRAPLTEKNVRISFADMEMNEGASDFPWNRYTRGADGAVYVGIPRNEYEITVFSADGEHDRIIRRRYESLPRTPEEIETARRVQKAIGANFPRPPQRIVVEDLAADLSGVHIGPDGLLWVQTSRGDRNPPEGCWVVLDVFDTGGKFVRQVALAGDHDAASDRLSILPDGRVIIVVSAVEGWLNQMGAVDEETGAADESQPLEIICYRLELE